MALKLLANITQRVFSLRVLARPLPLLPWVLEQDLYSLHLYQGRVISN
ncbi:TPA: hypothetical protein ACRQ15_003930 [Escherichia coli]|nr:hypothetical protein [Escherichia coli]MCS1608408.1 hypothetical protein [Escherichia coli]MCS1614918.1 hypothetical protein [Escherichia coli]MDL4426214.1 hypothetical protein [Escherichia coli]WNL92632.1 hypothetical protein RNO65_06990 [Escherichia coli]